MANTSPTLRALAFTISAVVSFCGLAAITSSFASDDRAVPISWLVHLLIDLVYAPALGVVNLALLVTGIYLWCYRPIATGQVHFGMAGWLGLLVVALLSAAWYTRDGWSLGVQWLGCAAISMTVIAVAACIAGIGQARQIGGLSLASRWLLLAWAGTYGFPYYGHMP